MPRKTPTTIDSSKSAATANIERNADLIENENLRDVKKQNRK